MRMLIAAFAVALSCLPVAAAECKFPMDETMGSLSAAGAPISIVKPEDLADLLAALEPQIGKIEGATRAFIFGVSDGVLLGIEVDGCLLPPIRLTAPVAPPQLSGRGADGKTGA